MTSMFTNSRLLPDALKRRARTTKAKPEVVLTKAKPLDILPNVSEEDEGRYSISSISSLDSPGYASRSLIASTTLSNRLSLADRKRNSRRVVLTGVEGLTFEDFFPTANAPSRPAPALPLFESTALESPLDDIDLRFSGLGISLDFPSPPSVRSSTSCQSPVSRTRDHSPTPSVSSAHTTTTTASCSSSRSQPTEIEITPPTSEDETPSPKLRRAPTFRSQRATVLFMKSMPDLSSPLPHSIEKLEGEGETDEDADWFAKDISDVVTLSSSLPPPPPLSLPPKARRDPSARPDSIALPRRTGRSRHSKPLPKVPSPSQASPSMQLDPAFPPRRKSFVIPNHPPPPPPIVICASPTPSAMEDATEELLAELAYAALNSSFLGTGLGTRRSVCPTAISVPPSPSSAYCVPTPGLRPPPRMSLPADINDLMDEAPFTPSAGQVEIQLEAEAEQTWPMTPQSISVYSQASMSADALPMSPSSSFEFEMEIVTGRAPGPSSLAALEQTPERVLRSRWSSSTLGSMVDRSPSSAPFWIPKFNLSPTKKSAQKRGSPQKIPVSPAKRSFEAEHQLRRRDSRSSRLSSDSGDSSSSSGLRRKPIPVEIFMR